MKKILFILILLSALTQPLSVSAQATGLPFGGFVTAAIPCTCVPGILVQYSLLHPVLYPFVSHSLLLTPASIRYAYQQFLVFPPPTAWHLGQFVPAPTPCLGVAPACSPVPFADGTILYTGSSFPGHALF